MQYSRLGQSLQEAPVTIDALASLYMPQDEITSVTENNYLYFVEQEAKKRDVQYRKGNTYKSRASGQFPRFPELEYRKEFYCTLNGRKRVVESPARIDRRNLVLALVK